MNMRLTAEQQRSVNAVIDNAALQWFGDAPRSTWEFDVEQRERLRQLAAEEVGRDLSDDERAFVEFVIDDTESAF